MIFAELDSLPPVSSLFDSWFGYILWAFCYFHLNRGKSFSDKRHLVEWILNVVMLVVGKRAISILHRGKGLLTHSHLHSGIKVSSSSVS